MHITREELKPKLERILMVAGFLAKLTPNTIDDRIVAFGQQAIQEDWVLDLLVSALNSFEARGAVVKP